MPFFIALALQLCLPKANRFLSRYKGLAFYFWAVALFLTLGQTIHFIFLNGKGNWNSILWLGLSALLFCIIQFGLGKWIGQKYGDTIAGGQLLGQKNSAMGIWMANHYLHPLASVFLAFYSVFQNLFNSWQIWYYNKKKKALWRSLVSAADNNLFWSWVQIPVGPQKRQLIGCLFL